MSIEKGNLMDTKKAILSFSQSEKIKTGLIWASQTLEINMGIQEPEKRGSQTVIAALMNMIANEIHIVMQVAPHERWTDALKHVNKALVMINSNVAHDAAFHISKALSQVTSIGHESMSVLAEKKLV
jgi:hypothetical protein